jgi:type I restriction enzyme R subunit
VGAYKHFSDPEWDGEPLDQTVEKIEQDSRNDKDADVVPVLEEPIEEKEPKKKLKIKLRDGKEREIQHMMSTSFWSADGKPISLQEFMDNLFGELPEFFKDEEELRTIWSDPVTRQTFLDRLEERGYDVEKLHALQKMINAEHSDLFDVFTYISFLTKPVSRAERSLLAKTTAFDGLNERQKEFLDFVLSKYEEKGVEELGEEKLPVMLNLKYHAIADAELVLGNRQQIRSLFFSFQKSLYSKQVVRNREVVH